MKTISTNIMTVKRTGVSTEGNSTATSRGNRHSATYTCFPTALPGRNREQERLQSAPVLPQGNFDSGVYPGAATITIIILLLSSLRDLFHPRQHLQCITGSAGGRVQQAPIPETGNPDRRNSSLWAGANAEHKNREGQPMR